MSDDMGMAEEAMNDAIVESAGYDDVQAIAPDEAEALIKKNADQINALLAQVVALKKIVIGERSQKIYDEKFGHISISHPDDCDLFLERLKIADDEARDRLAKEYPKVDWYYIYYAMQV